MSAGGDIGSAILCLFDVLGGVPNLILFALKGAIIVYYCIDTFWRKTYLTERRTTKRKISELVRKGDLRSSGVISSGMENLDCPTKTQTENFSPRRYDVMTSEIY